jgi:hypothetical protein
MRCMARLAAESFVAAVVLVAAPRVAKAQEGEYDSTAMEQSRGLHLGVGPTLLLPLRSEGPYGGGVTVEGRYGIQVGPTVVAPGARAGGYVIADRVVVVAMPMARVVLPVGPLAPYLVGGVGIGGLTNDSEGGAALLGGGGLMIHVGRVVAFGAEGTYQTITGTELHTWIITPTIAFGG